LRGDQEVGRECPRPPRAEAAGRIELGEGGRGAWGGRRAWPGGEPPPHAVDGVPRGRRRPDEESERTARRRRDDESARATLGQNQLQREREQVEQAAESSRIFFDEFAIA